MSNVEKEDDDTDDSEYSSDFGAVTTNYDIITFPHTIHSFTKRKFGGRFGGRYGSGRDNLSRHIRIVQTFDLQEMSLQTLDNTLTRDELREVQGQLHRMEQALIDRLEISFTSSIDVPDDDSKTDDDPDD
ncbi:hypothetical protein Syun_027714 [Stephania yunnanensis]|uniref:Uncharacterized protein n=1 Tax=Stephania yunnanensis TaxID=152371 RepID=A0AAP0HLA5_9MAGN